MRPSASTSGTLSRSGGCTSKARMRSSASAPGISAPPKAKQSSLSWAIGGLKAALRQDEGGDAGHVVEIEARYVEAGHRRVRCDRDDLRIFDAEQRLPQGRPMHFEFREAVALEAFDEHQIDRA